MRMSVGVGVHKSQLMAHWRSEDGVGGGSGVLARKAKSCAGC